MASDLVGFYGGTFDPVHIGHIHAARAVREALDLDVVHMILAARPGHRNEPAGSTDHRWRMLQAVCAEYEELVADDRELHRSGPSYTLATLREALAESPDSTICWILGQDSFATLPIWHRWQELLRYCNLIVVDRPGDFREEPAQVHALCDAHEQDTLARDEIGQIVRLQLPMIDVSATQIRRQISSNERYEHLLAHPVYTYIEDHGLYTNLEDPV